MVKKKLNFKVYVERGWLGLAQHSEIEMCFKTRGFTPLTVETRLSDPEGFRGLPPVWLVARQGYAKSTP